MGDSGVSYWYVAGDPVEVTVRVADTGLAKDTPALSARNAWMREPRPEEAERDAVVALLFDVVLKPAGTERVMVDYETRNGTAFAGEDYETKSGTLTFEPGETLKTVEVRVLDDTHDEGSETMRLVLSNARGAAITDAEATGTINNTDPMPKSWLARFGRTALQPCCPGDRRSVARRRCRRRTSRSAAAGWTTCSGAGMPLVARSIPPPPATPRSGTKALGRGWTGSEPKPWRAAALQAADLRAAVLPGAALRAATFQAA